MAHGGLAHAPHTAAVYDPLSVPWVILAAVLIGGGLLAVWYWITSADWLYFAGIIPTTLGGLMLFDRRAGADHA